MLIGVVASQQWNDRSGADNDLERYMQYRCSSTRVQRQVALSVRKCRPSGRSDEISDRGTSNYSGNYPSRFRFNRYVLNVQQLWLAMVSWKRIKDKCRVFRENTLWSAEVEASWHLLYSWFIQKVNHDIGGFSRVYLTHFRGFIRHIFEGLSAIFGGFRVIICENSLGTF